MTKLLKYGNVTIEYILTYKNVKNINLRIKPDGTVNVSANRVVPQRIIDEFILSKADFIIKALKKYKTNSHKLTLQYFSEDEIKSVILNFCRKAYPYFEKQGVKYPQIKFRAMCSRWGSCNPAKGILSFNTNLMYAPGVCRVCCAPRVYTLSASESLE